MVYLISAIIFGSLFAVMFRLFQQNNINSEQAIMFNYLTGLILSLIPIISNYNAIPTGGLYTYILSYRTLFALVQGTFFVGGFIIMAWSTWRSGVALTTVAARASLILSITFCWLFLGQSAPSWIPITLIVIALLLIILPNKPQERNIHHTKSKSARKRKAAFSLIAVFLFYGISDFSLKFVQHSVERDFANNTTMIELQLNILTTTIFVMAAILSFIYCLLKGYFKTQPLQWKTFFGGLVLGIINIGCTSYTLRALGFFSTSTFYPLYNISTVILATIIGIIFFKEKIKWLQIMGLLFAIVAIALSF
ncbi:MAG: hypothetical protein KBT27_12940 [Prevotellaceae bacterium]|nr:hypothetical protein [Candidatus Faecinaster equi]